MVLKGVCANYLRNYSVSPVSEENKTIISENSNSMFEKIETNNVYCIVYHKDTKVMYAVSNNGYNSGEFTQLVDESGKPLCWDETKEKPSENESLFSIVQDPRKTGQSFFVVYHKENKVMYTISYSFSASGIFTLLTKADGSPFLYTEPVNMQKNF